MCEAGVEHSDICDDMSLDIEMICSTVGTLPDREWLPRGEGRGGVSEVGTIRFITTPVLAAPTRVGRRVIREGTELFFCEEIMVG